MAVAKTKEKRVQVAWTKADIKELKRLFPSRPTAEVAVLLSRPLEAVKKKAQRLGLTKSKRYMKTLGRRA